MAVVLIAVMISSVSVRGGGRTGLLLRGQRPPSVSTGLTISIMKSAKSLTSALHSFSRLSSLLFQQTLFQWVLSSFPPLVLPATPHALIAQKSHLPLPHLLHQLTSLVHILHFCTNFFFHNPSILLSIMLLSLHSPFSTRSCFGFISLLGAAY